MGHKPQKKWGQNFLRNRGAVEQIVAALEPDPTGLVLEIGPGEGALTDRLAELPNRILAWEIDPSLATRLRARHAAGRFEVAEVDATEAALPEEPYWAVGNLPYNVATPIVRRIVGSSEWRRAVFMFQKEVADKLTAKPGDDEYGYLTLAVGLRAEARPLLTLAPGSFYPKPKVRSGVVVLEPVKRELRAPMRQIEDLISSAFRMRRKTLLNNLIGFQDLDRAGATEVIVEAGLDPRARAETLGLEEFDRLALVSGQRRADDRPPLPRVERP